MRAERHNSDDERAPEDLRPVWALAEENDVKMMDTVGYCDESTAAIGPFPVDISIVGFKDRPAHRQKSAPLELLDIP